MPDREPLDSPIDHIQGGWPIVGLVALLIVGVFFALISGHNGLAISLGCTAAVITWRVTD